MQSNSWLLPAVTLVSLGVFLAVWFLKACSGWLTGSSAVPVRIERASRGTMPYALQASGELRPVKEANVVARISGTVKEINYKVGDLVAEGAVIATLVPTELLRRIATEEVNRNAARNQFAAKEQELAAAEKQLAKTHEWLKHELIAKHELDQAQLATDIARAQVELAKAQVAQLDAMLAQSRKVLGLARLTAPFTGLVTDRMVEPGAKVGDSTAIVTIASVDTLKATIRVSETDASLFRAGGTAQVRLDETPADVLEGKVTLPNFPLEAGGDRLIEVHVSNRNNHLKAGAKVSVAIASDSAEDVLFVPAAALLEARGKDYVYTVLDGKAQRKEVVKRGTSEGKAAIKDGLWAGEAVVVWGQQSLSPDSRVRVIGHDDAEETKQAWLSLLCFSDSRDQEWK